MSKVVSWTFGSVRGSFKHYIRPAGVQGLWAFKAEAPATEPLCCVILKTPFDRGHNWHPGGCAACVCSARLGQRGPRWTSARPSLPTVSESLCTASSPPCHPGWLPWGCFWNSVYSILDIFLNGIVFNYKKSFSVIGLQVPGGLFLYSPFSGLRWVLHKEHSIHCVPLPQIFLSEGTSVTPELKPHFPMSALWLSVTDT